MAPSGRRPCFETQQFVDTNLPLKSGRKQLVCSHCLAAFNDNRRSVPAPRPVVISARTTTCKNHIRDCQYFKEAVEAGRVVLPHEENQAPITQFLFHNTGRERSTYQSLPRSSRSSSTGINDENSSSTSDKRQRGIRDFFTAVFTEEELDEFERLLVQFQADNFLPDRFIERKSTIRLFVFLNKACSKALPSRMVLGGRLLDKHSTVVEEEQFEALRNRQVFSGGRVNFMSDVWQDISKSHLLGCQLGLFGTMANYGLYSTKSRHDGLAIAEQMESVMKDMKEKGWNLGAVVTDNAGQCERARGILALRHPRLSYIPCMAHDTNNLVKSVLNSTFRKITGMASLATVTLNASSSKWLPRAKGIVKATYGTALGFINLCETRWNSMQGCFASLLRVRSALYHFAVMNDADRDFPEALKIFTNKTFWDKLASAERIIRPLSNVSYKLQRDENTLADVVESYRDIYGGFLNEYSSCELVSVVEKRWKKFEQPLMLLALFLHPVHVKLARIIDEEVPELKFFERLVGYATYYYRRYCETDDTEGLAGELHSWYRGKFVDSKIVQFNGDVGGYWSFVSDIRKQSKLPKLAAVILSIAVNTATCERYFSELAAIHTAKKNKMKSEKARKFSLVRKAIRLLDGADGAADIQLKRIVDPTERKFMNDNDTPLVIPVSLADIEESRIISLQEEPSADTADYWQDIYDVLDSDLMNDELDEIEGEQLEQGIDFDQPVFNGIDEAIPDPDTTPFPPHNDKTFPQEKKLIGIRGQTFRLATLFPTKRTFQQAPYSTMSEA